MTRTDEKSIFINLFTLTFSYGPPIFSWTDELTEDSELPPVEEKFDSERNIKTVVRYFFNEDGDLIKETKEYQREKRVVASRVADRKKWKKFGASKSDPSGGNLANTYPADIVTMQIVQSRQACVYFCSFTIYLLFKNLPHTTDEMSII